MNKLLKLCDDLQVIINEAQLQLISSCPKIDQSFIKRLELVQRDIMEFSEHIPDIQESAVSRFCAGVHTVDAGLSAVVYEDCPDEWTEKPFANIVYDYDHGDPSVGIMPTYGWILAPNQEGTVIEELVKKRS